MASPLRTIEPSPRVKLAVQLHVSGAAKTKREASRQAGLHPAYLSMLTGPSGSTPVKRYMDDLQRRLDDRTVEVAPIMQELGRRAIAKLADLMENAKPEVALRAAVDLADRSPETSKTQKIDLTSLSISGQDATELAKALIESAREREKYSRVTVEGLEEVTLIEPPIPPQLAEKVTDVRVQETPPSTTDAVQ